MKPKPTPNTPAALVALREAGGFDHTEKDSNKDLRKGPTEDARNAMKAGFIASYIAPVFKLFGDVLDVKGKKTRRTAKALAQLLKRGRITKEVHDWLKQSEHLKIPYLMQFVGQMSSGKSTLMNYFSGITDDPKCTSLDLKYSAEAAPTAAGECTSHLTLYPCNRCKGYMWMTDSFGYSDATFRPETYLWQAEVFFSEQIIVVIPATNVDHRGNFTGLNDHDKKFIREYNSLNLDATIYAVIGKADMLESDAGRRAAKLAAKKLVYRQLREAGCKASQKVYAFSNRDSYKYSDFGYLARDTCNEQKKKLGLHGNSVLKYFADRSTASTWGSVLKKGDMDDRYRH